MRSLCLAQPKENLAKVLAEAEAFGPSLVVFFAAPSIFRDPSSLALLHSKLKNCKRIGCSTAGEITREGYRNDSISMLALAFDNTEVKTAAKPLTDSAQSYDVGTAIGLALKAPNLKAMFVLAPGTRVNGSALVNGLHDVVGRNVVISGGLAGDEMSFTQTFTMHEDDIHPDHVVAVGLYGESIRVSCGSEGGWKAFGPARRVTRAEANILYELDGRPALQLYKQYLGAKAKQLPASGLSYPFAILRSDRSTSGIIRSALGINHENESLILAGDMPQGCQVCLMHADTDALIQGAAQAAAEALRTHEGSEENGCALIVNCVGRRMILGIDVDDEIDAVRDSFLPNTAIAGFYSYGEICSYVGTGRTELHNQTMTITYITERPV